MKLKIKSQGQFNEHLLAAFWGDGETEGRTWKHLSRVALDRNADAAKRRTVQRHNGGFDLLLVMVGLGSLL